MNSVKVNGIKIEPTNFDSDELSPEMQFDHDDGDFDKLIKSSEVMSKDSYFAGNEDDLDDVIVLHMDIRDPLSTLRTLVEHRVGFSLYGYEFMLQDAQKLEPHKNLVDQCVQGEGLVQINAQVQTINRRINIVDVLKPTDEALAKLNGENPDSIESDEDKGEDEDTGRRNDFEVEPLKTPEHADRWMVDKQFKKDQARLRIPEDPNEWSVQQVKHWLQWAVRQFNLGQIRLQDWAISGKELCSMTLTEFKKKVPNDPADIFWTHLELLRKCQFVAVIQKVDIDDLPPLAKKSRPSPKVTKLNSSADFNTVSNTICDITVESSSCGNRSGNNGQIQLWQFLLEILTDRSYIPIIQWMGSTGEFKLTDPERVAQLWGERKNKPTMNYEKLSRALRYYYDGDMISKVHGKRFVYKFVCDLKTLIGYNAGELSQLVSENEYMIY